MMTKAKTAAEIKRGLKHCTGPNGCYKCPYSECDKSTASCQLQIDRDALKLIESLEAEIKRLKEENEILDPLCR